MSGTGEDADKGTVGESGEEAEDVGDFRITRKEVPSAVLGSAKEVRTICKRLTFRRCWFGETTMDIPVCGESCSEGKT